MTIDWLDLKELKAGEDIFVTINPQLGTKKIYINSLASDILGEETRWVRVGIDYDERKLIIKPLRERIPEALGMTKATSNGDLNVKLLVNSRLIDMISDFTGIEDTTRFQGEWNEDAGFLEIDLTRKANSRFGGNIVDFNDSAYNG